MKMRRVTKERIVLVIFLTLLAGGSALAIDKVYSVSTKGKIVDPGTLTSKQNVWVAVNTVVSAGDEPTDLAEDERTYAAVLAAITAAVGGDEKIAVYDMPEHWNHVQFECIGITEDATATFLIYAGTRGGLSGTDCNLGLVGQLAFVIGTQGSTTATYEMADAVTKTASDGWIEAWGVVSPGSDRVARGAVNVMDADVLVTVPTVASANCKLLAKGY